MPVRSRKLKKKMQCAVCRCVEKTPRPPWLARRSNLVSTACHFCLQDRPFYSLPIGLNHRFISCLFPAQADFKSRHAQATRLRVSGTRHCHVNMDSTQPGTSGPARTYYVRHPPTNGFGRTVGWFRTGLARNGTGTMFGKTCRDSETELGGRIRPPPVVDMPAESSPAAWW